MDVSEGTTRYIHAYIGSSFQSDRLAIVRWMTANRGEDGRRQLWRNLGCHRGEIRECIGLEEDYRRWCTDARQTEDKHGQVLCRPAWMAMTYEGGEGESKGEGCKKPGPARSSEARSGEGASMQPIERARAGVSSALRMVFETRVQSAVNRKDEGK